MLFENVDRRFELTLTVYQFPEIVDHKSGANWLDVHINDHLPDGSYAASSPCLLTWEVGWMVRWLENIAGDVPHSVEVGGIEPYLKFEHVLTDGQMIILRVHVKSRMAPRWLCNKSQSGKHAALDFTMTRSQVTTAAASLHSQLQQFPPRAGAETTPPFTIEELSPHFFIDWLLLVPGATRDEAAAIAVDYLRWINLEPVVRACSPLGNSPEEWAVRLVTTLSVSRHEPFRALFELLSRLPMPYGLPRVAQPYLRPDGYFTYASKLAPTREEPEDQFSRVRGHFELTNREDEQRYRRFFGERPSRVTPS